MKEFLVVFCVIFGTLIFIGAGTNKFSEIACHNQWGRSGMKVDYSFAGGCLIELPNGKWIPTKAMKYFGEEK